MTPDAWPDDSPRAERARRLADAIQTVTEAGYEVKLSRRPPLGLKDQKLWVCRWGTMTALVWAQSKENAENRVRHGVFDRKASLAQVFDAPQQVHGEVRVRPATDADIETFAEMGGKVPA